MCATDAYWRSEPQYGEHIKEGPIASACEEVTSSAPDMNYIYALYKMHERAQTHTKLGEAGGGWLGGWGTVWEGENHGFP